MNTAEPYLYTGIIIKAVARKHKVGVDDLLGRSRRAYIVAPRQEAYAKVFEAIGSKSGTAAVFGRDHTTILSGIRRHEKRTGQCAK